MEIFTILTSMHASHEVLAFFFSSKSLDGIYGSVVFKNYLSKNLKLLDNIQAYLWTLKISDNFDVPSIFVFTFVY